MLTKSILTATALALVAGVGSASAGDRFNNTIEFGINMFDTLTGLHATPLSSDELDIIRGSHLIIISPAGSIFVTNPPEGANKFMSLDTDGDFMLDFGEVTFTTTHAA